MKVKTLYQTLENRGNFIQVNREGPFSCHWKNTWLGSGYYFWDTFLENAHWWGEVRYKNNYVICKATCNFDNNNCFDLVGDTEHMLDFDESVNYMRKQNTLTGTATVARVLDFMKKKIGFPYEAIRVYGINSISQYRSEYEKYRYRLIFELSKPQFLDYKPAIQICIFEKKGLNLRDFKIIFPEYEYDENYVI